MKTGKAMFSRTFAIMKKEVRQLTRDTRLLTVIFMFPVLLLTIFGFAVNFDVKHIKLAVYDQDKSELSRDFIKSLQSSEYFDLVQYASSYSNVDKSLDEKIVQCVVVIPNNLTKKINSGEDVQVQYIIDGVDANTGSIIQNYVNAATLFFNQKISSEILAKSGIQSYMPISIETQFWFNPD
ncbi:MAG: ABC transporter permease, partial [Ignavibacterium sp.]